MFSLESSHKSDSNEYTQYKNENHPDNTRSAAMGFFSEGLKNELEAAVVTKPSVFEPLKVNCSFSALKSRK